MRSKTSKAFPGAFLAPLAASIVQPVISSVVKGISGEELEVQEENIWIKIFSSALYLITNSFKYKPIFNGVFSRNNLPRIIDGVNAINRDEKKRSKGTHWVSLFIVRNTAVYFHSFRIEHIPEEALSKI